MKSVAAVLLLAAVGCHAGVITIRTQSLPQMDSFPGSSFFLTNSGPGMPLKTLQVDLQGNAQAYSSVFTDRRSSFFDSGLSAWLDQQMSALDQMQAVLDQAPMMRPPCARMAAAQQAAQPDMFSYMAVSRFGPAVLSSLAEQAAQDVIDADAIPETIDMEDMSPGQLADWTGEDFVADGSGGFITISSFPDEFPREGRGFEPTMLAEEDGYPMYSPYVETDPLSVEDIPVKEDTDGPAWFFVFQDGSLNWGFILFALLLLAVVPLWCHILRAAARLSSCSQRRSREGSLAAAAEPLLGKAFLQPLAPEKPVAERPCLIEVASEHVPAERNDYVTIAYVPLKGEH